MNFFNAFLSGFSLPNTNSNSRRTNSRRIIREAESQVVPDVSHSTNTIREIRSQELHPNIENQIRDESLRNIEQNPNSNSNSNFLEPTTGERISSERLREIFGDEMYETADELAQLIEDGSRPGFEAQINRILSSRHPRGFSLWDSDGNLINDQDTETESSYSSLETLLEDSMRIYIEARPNSQGNEIVQSRLNNEIRFLLSPEMISDLMFNFAIMYSGEQEPVLEDVQVGLTEKEISSIKLVPNEKEETECSICFDNVEIGKEVFDLKCKHIFHKDCVQEWFNRSKVCPNCRSSLI